MGQVKSTLEKLKKFKKKYYINLLIRGGIFAVALILSLFLIFNYLEFWLHLNKTFRQILFFGFLLLVGSTFYIYILRPVIFLFNFKKQISDEKAAEIIGQKFTFINDKLLNTIQLLKYSHENPLAAASLYQRESDYKDISFSTAINLKENTRFLKYLILPLLCFIIVLILFPSSLVESTSRIINYNKQYAIKAPFSFVLLNKDLKAFKDEDYTVDFELEGKALPETVYLNNNGRKYKMEQSGENKYSFTFKKIQANSSFFIEGAGFDSDEYVVKVVNRPLLFELEVELKYPAYLNKKAEVINNAGNLTVPEGTDLKWNFNTLFADSVLVSINKEQVPANEEEEEGKFTISRKVKENSEIKINIKNEFATSKDNILYQINVIKDQFPQLNINTTSDTILFNNLIVGGNALDDYGISKLQLFYQIQKSATGNSKNYKKISIPITKNSPQQNFYMNWKLDSFNLKPGERIEYFVQAWDNDGVNGPKSVKSSVAFLQVPEKEIIKESLSQADKKTASDIEKALESSEDLRKDLSEIKEDLKVKKKATWQDQKKLEELTKKKQELEEQIKKIQEENTGQNLQKEKFLNPDERILEKLKMLEKLMNNLLDDETKKLYEQLQKLLKEQNTEQLPNLLEKINKKELNLEKELERALEMFRKMEFEQKLENSVEELKELKEKQEQLAKESLDKKSNQDSLIERQNELSEEFKEKEKDIEELKKMNQELENSNPMQDTKEEQEEIKKNQEESLEQLKNNKNKKSSEKQSKAAEEMQKLSNMMEEMQNSMESEAQEENIGHLRDILENLLTLSFDQESLMKEFKNVNQSDPRYITLSQKQLKIKDDAKIIEDSLISLAKRVFQIESFITREVGSMNENIEESLDNLKKRRPAVAASKQQFAMKSMNELALLLNDVLKQMQEQMANASGMGKKKKGKKNSPSPGLSELQKQLNEQINQLMKSGKTGKALSEGLAKMAAEQEMIRQALEKLQKSSGNPGGNLDKLIKEMEKTEEDLVNKRLGQQTINRQREILTRLLESEKSQKERDLDEKREATSAKQIEKQFEDKYNEYLKLKEKEIEFIKTLPPSFNSYYKNQVNNYFKSIKN